MNSYRKKYNSAVAAKSNVLISKERYNFHGFPSKTLVIWPRMAKRLYFLSLNRKMPSIYHEHCGKPGPKSNDYLPPPEARVFKSRSAPNSPLLNERKSLIPRGSPRLARGLNRLSDKLAAGKGSKSGKVERSKSFTGKGMFSSYI